MEKLVEILENYVEVDEITAESTFKFDLGLSSFDTMCIITDIKGAIGVELKPTDFVKNKTVGEMAQYIASLK
ncbi:MAG: acyl carrier protein [Clostridia bacterium]|nr:acyl carrier protein [Clostridia bacterium]